MRMMNKWPRIVIGLVAASLVVVSCGGDDAGATSTTEPVVDEPTTSVPDPTDREPAKLPERVPGDLTTGGVTGEVPSELLEPVIAAAAELAGVDPADTRVVTAQEMMWPDGSLGCAEPGMMYTQAIVPGYWVIVEAGGEGYDYRLDDQGRFRLCTLPFTGPGGTAPTE